MKRRGNPSAHSEEENRKRANPDLQVVEGQNQKIQKTDKQGAMSNTSITSPQSRPMISVSRVYADANSKRPKEYSDYDNLVVNWGYAFSLFS